jgi:hypothetical protein
MERFAITQTESGFRIEGFPDGAKVVRIDGPKANRLSDLSLHKSDLEFADDCLNAINDLPKESILIREALWRSAIVHFLKCFGDAGARFQLSADRIYSTEPPEAKMAYAYFKGLRNKHLIHDENSYAQSVPGAILNKGNKKYKIEKIVCMSAIARTLESGNYSNLKLLIKKAREWVVSEFENLCDLLTKELEKISYEALLAREAPCYRAPTVDDINKNRKKS